MASSLVATLALCLGMAASHASPWPEFPAHPYPVDADDVKEYWFEALPRPEQPSRTSTDYAFAIRSYHLSVSIGRDLIRQLQAGVFDRDAHLVALRHNLAYYQGKDLNLWIKTTGEAIARAEAELLALPPQPALASVTPGRRSTGLRTSGLRLGRLEGSGGLYPHRRSSRPAPGSHHVSSPPSHSSPPEPDIIYIEVEDEDDDHASDSCPPPHSHPTRPSRPPLDIKPWPQIPDPPVAPAPKPEPKPSSSPQPSSSPAPSRSASTSTIQPAGRRQR